MSVESLVEQRAMVAGVGKGFAVVSLLAMIASIWGGAPVGGVAVGMLTMACAAWSIYHVLAYTARIQNAYEMLKIHRRLDLTFDEGERFFLYPGDVYDLRGRFSVRSVVVMDRVK